jgi:ABC-type transport system substrate-binding protein
VRDVLAGFGSRADSAIPPTSWAFDPVASPAQATDPDAAIAGLTSAGWVRGDGGWTPKGADAPFKIEIVGPERDVNPVAYETAEAVAGAWRAIGLGVTHLALDATVLADRLRAGDFDVAVIGVNVGLDPDLYPLLASSQTTGARTNVLGLQDPVLDSLLAAARAPGTTEARRVAYSALQVRLTASTYLLPIAVRDEIALVTDGLSGASIRPIGDAGGRFWDVLTWRLANGR